MLPYFIGDVKVALNVTVACVTLAMTRRFHLWLRATRAAGL